MEGQGLDVDKLGVLRHWGTGLQTDPREEVAAAGRAILLLIEEIERLHVLLWDKRLYPDTPITPPGGAPAHAAGEEPGRSQQTLAQALRDRLGLGRHGDASPAETPWQDDSHA